MARIITVNAQTGKVESMTTLVRKQLQIFLMEITVIHMDVFGCITVRTYLQFRIFKKEIHLDIEEAMQFITANSRLFLH